MYIFNAPLIEGKILKRYKRFFADVRLANSETIVAHVPNTGSMQGCWAPEDNCLLSSHHNKPGQKVTRKLLYTLEFVKHNNSWIGVNTHIPNKLVYLAIKQELVPEITSPLGLIAEKTYGASRIDLFIPGNETLKLSDCYIEIKNVTLKADDQSIALFPDAKTTRGQKHLKELIKIKEDGHRAILFFLINRSDVDSFSPAYTIDPVYAEYLSLAISKGVEIICKTTSLDLTTTPGPTLKLSKNIPVIDSFKNQKANIVLS